MVQCSAPGCTNSSTKGFLLKRFPRDPERRARWANNIEKLNWEPTNNSYMCEVHFDDDQWEAKRVDRLKWNAVPTIFENRLKYTKRKDRTTPRVTLPIQPGIPCVVNQDQPQLLYIIKMDDYLPTVNGSTSVTGMNNGLKRNHGTTSESEVEANNKEMYKLSPNMREDREKDILIAKLKKELRKKHDCLMKYEKIICQMNSHLDKLKGRLKFWRDFRKGDGLNSRKGRKFCKVYDV